MKWDACMSNMKVDSIDIDTIPRQVEQARNLDWRSVSEARLECLVAIEHDYAVLRDRLTLVQSEYRQAIGLEVSLRLRIQDLELRNAHLESIEINYERMHKELEAEQAACVRALEELAVQQAEYQALQNRLVERDAEFARMHSAFLESRSWRLTRPLRTISVLFSRARQRATEAVRKVLRVQAIRRTAGFVSHRVPGLHRRLCVWLYPQDDA